MLDIAFELIGEATSNSLLMFCFCNFIIVMILTGSPNSGSMESQDPISVSPVSFNMCNVAYPNDHDYDDDDNDDDDEVTISSAEDELLINDSSVSDEDEARVCSHCNDDDDEDEDDDVDDESEVEEEEEDDVHDEIEIKEEEEDDDLRKRVEEFIAKINNEWKHEKLRASNLVY